MIRSDWACPAFDNTYCSEENPDEPCNSFKTLVRDHPKVACSLMDKMIFTTDDQEQHCFVLLEQFYYKNEG